MLVRSLGTAYCCVGLVVGFIVDCGFWGFGCLVLLLLLEECWWYLSFIVGFVVLLWVRVLVFGLGLLVVGGCWQLVCYLVYDFLVVLFVAGYIDVWCCLRVLWWFAAG